MFLLLCFRLLLSVPGQLFRFNNGSDSISEFNKMKWILMSATQAIIIRYLSEVSVKTSVPKPGSRCSIDGNIRHQTLWSWTSSIFFSDPIRREIFCGSKRSNWLTIVWVVNYWNTVDRSFHFRTGKESEQNTMPFSDPSCRALNNVHVPFSNLKESRMFFWITDNVDW